MSEHVYAAGAIARHQTAGYRANGPRRDTRSGAAGWLAVAALCLFGLAATWSASALVPRVRFKDAVTLHDFTLLSRPHVDAVAHALLSVLEPVPFTALAIALVALALSRRRPRLAVAVALVMALAPLSCELLKPLLAHAHAHVAGTHVAPASWPSGHATAATVLALCALLVAPGRVRPAVAAIGGLYTLAVGCSLLILAWHMPSDVIGGYLLGALSVAVALAVLRARGSARPRGVAATTAAA